MAISLRTTHHCGRVFDAAAAANNFLCQFQSDILDSEVSRPDIIETTAMGAAFLAGLAVGVWRDQDQIKQLWREDKRFTPRKDGAKLERRLTGWRKALERSKEWLD